MLVKAITSRKDGVEVGGVAVLVLSITTYPGTCRLAIVAKAIWVEPEEICPFKVVEIKSSIGATK
jgi:hypothetical protein